MNRIQTSVDELPAEQRILASIIKNLGDAWLSEGLAVAEIGPQVLSIHRRAVAHVARCDADLPGRVVSAVQDFAANGFDVRPMRCALEDAFPSPKNRLALLAFIAGFAEQCEENRQQRESGEAT